MASSRQERDVLSDAFEVVVKGVLADMVPSLGKQLGLSDVDMDAIKYAHQDDIMEQKRKMLSRWKQRLGTGATPGELMEACRTAELQDVADKIQNLIREDLVNRCEEDLKEYYRRNKSFYTPLNWAPWMEYEIPGHVKARFKRVHRHEGSTKRIVKSEHLTEDELLTIMEGDSSRQSVGRVIIEGPPGIGKTTFLKGLVCAWVSRERFTHQKLVFALKGRHLPEHGDLFDAILAQNLFPEDHPVKRNSDLKAHLWQWVENNQDKVMFIIDGIAEIPGFRKTSSATETRTEHFVTKLIEGKILRHSNVLLTTTSIQMLDVSVLRWCDAYYTIEGFFSDDINKFVDTFKFKTRKAKTDIKDLLGSYANTSLLELCRIPMFLLFLCLIWDDNEHKSKARTVTSLLEEIFDMALRKALGGKEDLSDEDQEKVEELCKLSWERTVSGNVCLMNEDVKNIKDLMLKSGFLVKEKSHRVEYTFGHSLFRQLFAAKHVVKFPDQTDLCEQLWEPNCPSSSRYSLVCLFVAGLLGAEAGPLFEAFAQRYSDMLKDDKCSQCCIDEAVTLACRCIVESRNPRSFGQAVANTLLEHMGAERELSINFYRKQVKLHTLLGLSYVIENINCMDSFGRINDAQRLSLILDNPWIRNKRGLVRLGEAIMKTQCVHTLAISVTGLDASLLHPKGDDTGNEDMGKFMQTIGNTQSNIAKLSITAQIDRMSESAIRQVSKAFRNNEELRELDLLVSLFSKRCSSRCQKLVEESHQPCTKKERIQVFLTDVAEAVDNMKWLESLRITASLLREDASRETIVPVLQRHEGITSLSVVGQVKGRGHLTLYGIQSLAMILEQNKKLKCVSVRLTTVSDDVKQREKDRESPRDPKDTRADTLYNGLVKSTVTSIDLLFNCVLAHEARLFADIVRNNPHLTEVTFSWHTMFPSFLERLADAVEKSGALKRLALCGKFGDGDSLVKLIRAVLPAKPPGSSAQAAGGISSLFLQGQPFLDTTIDALMSFLKTETSLDRPMLLHLGGELFGPQAEAASRDLDALRLEKEASDDNFIIYHGLSVVAVDEEKPNVFHFETKVAREFKRALRERSKEIVKSRQEEETES